MKIKPDSMYAFQMGSSLQLKEVNYSMIPVKFPDVDTEKVPPKICFSPIDLTQEEHIAFLQQLIQELAQLGAVNVTVLATAILQDGDPKARIDRELGNMLAELGDFNYSTTQETGKFEKSDTLEAFSPDIIMKVNIKGRVREQN